MDRHIMTQNYDYEWQLFVLLLKYIAEEKGITHQQIADNTGLIRSNITRFFFLKYKPGLDIFLKIAKAVGVNFFFEDRDSDTDLNKIFERAMEQLGRRPDNLPKN